MLDINNCVKGSTEGVKTAPTTVDPKITYLQAANIVCPDIILSKPNIICITGNWKAIPVLNSKTMINSKYCSNDQKGSTTSEP